MNKHFDTVEKQYKSSKTRFRIGMGKSFSITFDNGYTASVAFGPGNYCDNYNRGKTPVELQYLQGNLNICASPNAETLAWDANGKDICEAKGWQTPAQVLAFLNEIASLPPLTK